LNSYTQVYVELGKQGQIAEESLAQATIDELLKRGYSVVRKVC
jgi:hypothetical protein